MIGRITAVAFQFRFMDRAIDFINTRDPSNEMHHQLQPKKDYGKAVLAVYIAAKGILPALHC